MKPQLLVPILASALFACPTPKTESKPAKSPVPVPAAGAASQPASPVSQPTGAASQPAKNAISRRVEAAEARLGSQ